MGQQCVNDNGNCTAAVDPGDGLPVQCVGVWANDKHYYLRQYIEATRKVRAMYLPSKGVGGAAFVDLFAGPGRARLRETGEFIDGSPLIALKHEEAPFNRVVMCELVDENVEALRARTARYGERSLIVSGDCNQAIDRIIEQVPPRGLNIALIDPFGGSALSFATIRALGSIEKMDLIIHFPTGGFRRNFWTQPSMERFVGLPKEKWGFDLVRAKDIVRVIEVYKRQLMTLGYRHYTGRAPEVTNSRNTVLYHLVYASKHKRGDDIWRSVTKNEPSGQRGFNFA